MSPVIDDKSEHCIPFILEVLDKHGTANGLNRPSPLFIGINGVQGAGKTTLASSLRHTLSTPPTNLTTAVLSIDDFYLKRVDQQALAQAHSSNPLIQHRGQPSTHDLKLLTTTLASLHARNLTKLPVFDKSAHSGAGDRTDTKTWVEVNRPGEPEVDVVILEGWCVGFRTLSNKELEKEWRIARVKVDVGEFSQLGTLKFEDVKFVNDALRGYREMTELLDAFIHLDAEDTRWVYEWRLEAEIRLRREKGAGMTDDLVRRFVDGYYPAYELYTEPLRKGIYNNRKDHQLRLVMGKDRNITRVERI